MQIPRVQCEQCDGTGRLAGKTCERCHGHGYYVPTKSDRQEPCPSASLSIKPILLVRIGPSSALEMIYLAGKLPLPSLALH